ncbi:MAG TPA: hypothetical protein VG939_18140 [Caulobacteraceae bacterium]|nr:hypothetical protein [Caulobacteraceae bacterium]
MIIAALVFGRPDPGAQDAAPPANVASSEDVVFGNGGWDLSQVEVGELVKRAARGDGGAAFRLSLYWRICHGNHARELYWLNVGARNGNASAEYNLGFDLARSGDAAQEARAIHWLKKAKAAGVEQAGELLRELEREATEVRITPRR